MHISLRFLNIPTILLLPSPSSSLNTLYEQRYWTTYTLYMQEILSYGYPGHEAPDTQFLCWCWFQRQFVAHYSMKIFPHYAPQHPAVLRCNFMTSGISGLFILSSSSMFNMLYLIYPLLHMSKPFQLCLINLVSKPELSLLYILILSMRVIPSESGSFPEFSIFYLQSPPVSLYDRSILSMDRPSKKKAFLDKGSQEGCMLTI